jgi:glutathione S-transferase
MVILVFSLYPLSSEVGPTTRTLWFCSDWIRTPRDLLHRARTAITLFLFPRPNFASARREENRLAFELVRLWLVSHPETIAEFRPRAEAALSFVDKTVKDQPFLVGDDCTIADLGCWGRMVFMAEGGFDIDNWPHLAAWAGRLKAMPGFALPYELIPSKDREFDPV